MEKTLDLSPDGKADYNMDVNGDGVISGQKEAESKKELTDLFGTPPKWEPNETVEAEGPYCTMFLSAQQGSSDNSDVHDNQYDTVHGLYHSSIGGALTGEASHSHWMLTLITSMIVMSFAYTIHRQKN